MRIARRVPRVLPGFRLSLGLTLSYLSLLVLVPLSTLVLRAATLGGDTFWAAVSAPRVLHACGLSLGAALAATTLNALLGGVVAWSLVRYPFPGRRIADALVDLPLALPTAVAGIALTALYAKTGWFGSRLAGLGLEVAFAPAGVVVALTFVGLPFVVRTLQPVIEALDPEIEEAARSLGAGRGQAFVRVLAPQLLPAWLTGCALALARGLGEYGSVVFISGNMPLRTEIAPLVIMTKLEQYDYAGAAAVAVLMLAASFLLLLGVNLLQRWGARPLLAAEPA